MTVALLGVAMIAVASPIRATAQEAAAAPAVLEPGFVPDPVRFVGGAEVVGDGANQLGRCGDFPRRPAHIIRLSGAFSFLRIFTVAAGDVRFAVRTPLGTYRCGRADDDGTHLEGSFAAGRYPVWVASAESTPVRYELNLTEFRSVRAANTRALAAAAIDPADLGLTVDAEEGRFRDRRLRRGFLPDPRVDDGTAGGDVDIGVLGSRCAGLVERQPNHILTLRDDFDYFRIQLGPVPAGTTIVVRTPSGEVLCGAAEEGDPFVDRTAWPEGVYTIWVAARTEAERPNYRICYTEVRPAEGTVACGRSED